MAEAAEKRKREDEGRGVKDPEALKRKQQKREEIEKKAEQSGGGEGGLRVRN
jgi:small VCP/p97-interacting protein